MEEPLEEVWAQSSSGWRRVPGNHRGGQTALHTSRESSALASLCARRWVREEFTGTHVHIRPGSVALTVPSGPHPEASHFGSSLCVPGTFRERWSSEPVPGPSGACPRLSGPRSHSATVPAGFPGTEGALLQGVWDQPRLCLGPSSPSLCGVVFLSLGIGLLSSQAQVVLQAVRNPV